LWNNIIISIAIAFTVNEIFTGHRRYNKNLPKKVDFCLEIWYKPFSITRGKRVLFVNIPKHIIRK